MNNTYFVPTSRVKELVKKVEQINKKATKLATPPVSITVTDHTESRKVSVGGSLRSQMGQVFTYQVTKVIVTGSTPVIEGWQFVGVIRHRPAGNEIIRMPEFVQTADIDFSAYQFVDRDCDHCHKKRVRNATYLVYNASQDALKQVGSDCLGDFTGYNDPQQAAKACENIFKLFNTIQGYSSEVPRTTREFFRVEWLAFVAQSIRQHGWVSAKASWDTGELRTAHRAKINILNYYENASVEVPSAKDFEAAELADKWAWGDAHTDLDSGDFKDNFLAAFARETLTEHEMGITASVYACMARAAKEKAKVAAQVSQSFYGAKGDRVTLTLKVVRKNSFQGTFGFTTVYNMEDDQGHKFVWFNTGKGEMNVGETYSVSGTIKDHKVDNYSGDKQTLLTRCKVSEQTAMPV